MINKEQLKELGKKIYSLRIKNGLTQEELGKLVGYTSRSSINKIELGLIDIPQSKIVLLSKALNVTPAYLMGWEKSEEKTPITDERLAALGFDMEKIQKLTEEDLAVIAATIKTLLNQLLNKK